MSRQRAAFPCSATGLVSEAELAFNSPAVRLSPETSSPHFERRFFRHVSDDVDWIVEGTHSLAGHYRAKADFIAGTFAMSSIFS